MNLKNSVEPKKKKKELTKKYSEYNSMNVQTRMKLNNVLFREIHILKS